MSALSLAVRKSVVGLTRMLQIAAAMLGGALILFGLSHTLWLSLVLMVFVGFGLMQGASASNTIIQSLVPEDKRARVMSYYTMAFFGAAPFGSLLAGALAHRIGAPHTVIVTGAFCIAGSLWFTLELPKVNAVMRPIYQEMGLLPARDTIASPVTERKKLMPLTQLDTTPALIVIDLQKGIVGLPTVHPAAEIIGRAAQLARAFRERGLPVVLVNVTGMAPGRTDAGTSQVFVSARLDRACSGIGAASRRPHGHQAAMGRVPRHNFGRLPAPARRNPDCPDGRRDQRRRGIDGAQRLRSAATTWCWSWMR